jgi:valyl-tRNA synthetase
MVEQAGGNGTARLPERPSLDGLEAAWTARWAAQGIYRFDRDRPREEVYAIDTPPPTVSGSLHLGSVFSYTHPDLLARFQRMRGRAVFYPMGWDDNGLPTERRVEDYFGVRCDRSLPYDPAFTPPRPGGDDKLPVSRPNFVELCLRLTAQDEQAFEAIFRRLGLSVDWTLTYTTIGAAARRASQRAFVRLLAEGEAYQAEAPTLWDVTFRTAVAQAELVERELPGASYRIRFTAAAAAEDQPAVEVETTRPELLPACVALVAHPGDRRWAGLVGRTVTTPLFGVRVPVLAHGLADPAKGTGLAMVCTFGDTTDVTWWRELRLPVRAIVTRDGRIQPTPPGGVPDGGAWAELAGRTVAEARRQVAALLRASGDLVGEPRPIVHPVRFYERGERPLEIVTSRQWFIRLLDHRERLLELGQALAWIPPFMRVRYERWVSGLNSDWLISRQRCFGVPVPLWYPVTAGGEVDHDNPIVPDQERLPVDPSSDVPDGYAPEQRDRPGGFAADPDVMDTWATSSLTPQIAGGWEDDPDLFARVFPMDLRPQGPEIIRTWLFYTVVRSFMEHRTLPWRAAAISGWVLDPDRKKMSKSKGNVVTPADLLERYGSDAVRHWAARGRPGADTATDEAQIRVGRRLAVKLLNASRFVLGLPGGVADPAGEPAAPLDLALLAGLDAVAAEATASLEAAEWTQALERTEAFFWTFCDDYLELVKDRAYGDRAPQAEPGPTAGDDGAGSARTTLAAGLDVLLRLLAPYLPFATEEVWSWWRDGSVHLAPWPDRVPAGRGADPLPLEAARLVLGAVRRAKSEARLPLRTPVARVAVVGTPERLAAVRAAEADLRAAGRIATVGYREREAPPLAAEVMLSANSP